MVAFQAGFTKSKNPDVAKHSQGALRDPGL